mmetsp:Transcript_45020/g.84142  ORF Transcript_45020/g.84142 Transcript_45020/m.84142 type:complete len:88 (+) Transcript_45020:2-265(+)
MIPVLFSVRGSPGMTYNNGTEDLAAFERDTAAAVQGSNGASKGKPHLAVPREAPTNFFCTRTLPAFEAVRVLKHLSYFSPSLSGCCH